jgi:hypothetical protein
MERKLCGQSAQERSRTFESRQRCQNSSVIIEPPNKPLHATALRNAARER